MYNSSFNPYIGTTGMGSTGFGDINQFSPQRNNMMGAMRQQVVRVNGRNGAEAYQMPPNSSILLLDETAPIVWLKMTDGAGYPTVTPYDITPHQTEQMQTVDAKSLENRIARLEEIVNVQFSESQSDAGPSQPVKRVVATTSK